MNIDQMPAGPEMDRLVAEKVMGWRLDVAHPGQQIWRDLTANRNRTTSHLESYRDFSPSTSIAHAWEMVEALKGFDVFLNLQVRENKCWCSAEDYSGNELFSRFWAETASLVICRAALKAVTG